MKRKPAVAVLSLAAALCAAAFVVALGAGYLQTASALKLAENNAAVADAALSQVFTRIAEQPPSQKNTQLLSALLPYYRMIARGKICRSQRFARPMPSSGNAHCAPGVMLLRKKRSAT